MKKLLLMAILFPIAIFAQQQGQQPTNLPLRTRTATDAVTRSDIREEAKRKADSASMAARKDLKAFKDSVNDVITNIFGRMPVDTFTQTQADKRYATINQLALKQNSADAFTQTQADARYVSGSSLSAQLALKLPVAFKDTVTKYYGPSGLINKPMKVWSDTGIVVTANPMAVNISSAGFTVITSVQAIARNAGGLLSSVPIVSERPPHSTATVYFSLAVSNLLGTLGLLSSFPGTTISVRIEGY